MRMAPTKNQRNLKDFDMDGHKKSKNRRGRMLIRPYSQAGAFQTNDDFKRAFPNGLIPFWDRKDDDLLSTDTIETESTSDDSGNGD